MADDRTATNPADIETTTHAIWTDNWELIGGSPVSGPSASSWGPGQNIDVFWRGTDNHLKHKWFPYNNVYSWEEDLGGNLASEPASCTRSTNMRDVFWRGTDNHLKHKWYPYNNAWSWEEDLGGNLASAPAALSWGTTALHVFWKGSDGNLKHKSLNYSNNIWTAEEDLQIAIQSDPAAMYRNNGIMDVFWAGSDQHLKHIWYPYNNTWSWVQDLGGTLASGSSPTATRRWNGSMDVFWRGTDNRLKHKWYPFNGDWSWEQDLGGNMASSPDATSWGSGRMDIYAKDASSGQMAHKLWSEDANVDVISQPTGSWCWAATGQMIMRYFGVEKSQCEQANYAFGQTNCCQSPQNDSTTPAACNKGGRAAYGHWGFNTSSQSGNNGAAKLADIKKQVALARPWDHCIKFSDGGHHIVAGIDEFYFDGDDWVVINNPNGSGQYMQRYSQYVGSYGSCGDLFISKK
jgi:hypothetical protein